MDITQIKERIRQCALQQLKDISQGHTLVAVSNQSGYNVSSYVDFADAEKHAISAAAAFKSSHSATAIYLMVVDPRIHGLWQVLDEKLKLIE